MWNPEENMERGAGGFLDSTYNEDGTQAEKSDPQRGSSVVPLMAGHLLKIPFDNLKLWGMPIKLVSVVGIVQKVERVSTKISYELMDETGTIMAYQWIDDTKKKSPTMVAQGTYAKVIGTLREHMSARHIFILKTIPVKNMMTLFDHLLEVTYECLKAKELVGDQGTADKSMAVTSNMDSECCSGMNKEQALVFRTIRSENETETGIEKSALKNKLPRDVWEKLPEILEFLTSEGHIYSTCTDDHFKTT